MSRESHVLRKHRPKVGRVKRFLEKMIGSTVPPPNSHPTAFHSCCDENGVSLYFEKTLIAHWKTHVWL